MDPDQVRGFASQLRGQAQRINAVVGSVDAIIHQIGHVWQGPSATEFISWWQQQHRPNLVRIEQEIVGLAQAADHNVAEQSAASSSPGSAGSGVLAVGGPAAGLAAEMPILAGARSAAQQFSQNWGFVAGPLLTHVPVVGGVLGGVMQGDTGFRFGQAVAQHHYQSAYENEGSDMVSGALMGHMTVPTFLAGTDVIIAKHAEQAYRAVDWSYTVRHLSELDPLAPGALQAVGGAEASGLGSLGVDWFKQTIGALLS